ncbi:unnamed protein product [Caenorhabditis sp. 36 PRJEB53466]|nr:unnamed protein product [Caenorhabditis sp. 36 PRJEB53466]
MATSEARCAILSNQNKQLKSQIEVYKSENGPLKNKYEQLKIRSDKLSRELTDLKNKFAEKNEEIRLLKKEKTDRGGNSSTGSLRDQREIAALRLQNGNLERKVQRLENNQSNIQGQNANLQSRLDAEKVKLEVALRKFEEEKQRILLANDDNVESLRKSLAEAKSTIEKMNLKRKRNVDEESASQRIDELMSLIQKKNNFIELALEKEAEAENQKRDFERRVSELRVQVSTLHDDMEQLRGDNSQLSAQLRSLTDGNRNDLEDDTCLICRGGINGNMEEFEQLPKCNVCRRRYHVECLAAWCADHEQCPVCRCSVDQMTNFGNNFN